MWIQLFPKSERKNCENLLKHEADCAPVSRSMCLHWNRLYRSGNFRSKNYRFPRGFPRGRWRAGVVSVFAVLGCGRMREKLHGDCTIRGNLLPFFRAKYGQKSWYLLALWNSSDTCKTNCGNRYQLFSGLPGQPFKRKWDFGDYWWKIPSRQRGIWLKTIFLTLS